MAEPWMEAAQAELQPLIKAPKLTDKLLKKPPFRFLHDVISNYVKSTAFPKTYFSADELDSSKVTEKQAKIDFLGKMITILEAGLKTTCVAKPQIIVTGAEPENTCAMLVLMAKFDKLSDAEKENAANGGGGGAEADPAPVVEKAREKTPEKPREKTPPPAEEKAREATPPEKKEKAEKPREKTAEKKKREAPPDADAVPAVAPITPQQQDGGGRPGTATARKAPPKHENNTRDAEKTSGATAPIGNVIKESGKDDEQEKERDWLQVVAEGEVEALRAREAESKGAAVGYLGKQADEAMKEQQKKKEAELALAEAEGRSTGSGIVLSTKRRGEKASSGGMGEGEMTKLREQLQLLTKATNPLGKFLEAIHEDIDTMSRELEMWRTEARTQSTAAQEAQRQTEQSLHEVHGKLHTLEDQIGDQMTKINLMRKSILDNDKTVETLLKMVVNPDVGGKKH